MGISMELRFSPHLTRSLSPYRIKSRLSPIWKGSIGLFSLPLGSLFGDAKSERRRRKAVDEEEGRWLATRVDLAAVIEVVSFDKGSIRS